jgi:hypothetical protein
MSAPWHLVRAALTAVPAVILPLVLGVSAGLCAGVASGMTSTPSGHNQLSAAQIAAAVGVLVGVMVAWWGPGGSSVRRGARAMTRGVVRGRAVTVVVVLVCIAGGAAAAYLAVTRGQPDFAPLHDLPLGIRLPS